MLADQVAALLQSAIPPAVRRAEWRLRSGCHTDEEAEAALRTLLDFHADVVGPIVLETLRQVSGGSDACSLDVPVDTLARAAEQNVGPPPGTESLDFDLHESRQHLEHPFLAHRHFEHPPGPATAFALAFAACRRAYALLPQSILVV